jgi:hypothetical protein
VRHGQIGSCRDGVDHDSGERALAQLAHEQSPQKLLFCQRRPREQLAQRGVPTRRRAGTTQIGDGCEASIEFGNRQTWLGSDGLRAHVRQCAVADADAPLPRLAGEPLHAGLDLIGFESTHRPSELADLHESRRTRGDAPRGFDQTCERCHESESGIPAAGCRAMR